MTNVQTVFLHFPKTGGTSLGKHLKAGYATHYQVDQWRDLEPDKMRAAELIHGHLIYDQISEFKTKSFFVTLMRDPIERAISFYFHVKRSPSHPNYQLAQDLSLDEFVQSGAGSQQYLTQLTAMVPKPGEGEKLKFPGNVRERLELAKERLAEFDHVATTERLFDSMAYLSEKLGIPQTTMNRENTGGHGISRKDLSPASLESIRKKAWADIELHRIAVERSAQDLD